MCMYFAYILSRDDHFDLAHRFTFVPQLPEASVATAPAPLPVALLPLLEVLREGDARATAERRAPAHSGLHGTRAT